MNASVATSVTVPVTLYVSDPDTGIQHPSSQAVGGETDVLRYPVDAKGIDARMIGSARGLIQATVHHLPYTYMNEALS